MIELILPHCAMKIASNSNEQERSLSTFVTRASNSILTKTTTLENTFLWLCQLVQPFNDEWYVSASLKIFKKRSK